MKHLASFHTKYIQETNVVLKKFMYQNGAPALVLETAYGEPLCKATVNLEDSNEFPHEGCVFIKIHGENEGVYEELLRNKIIAPAIRTLPAGYVKNYAVECKLLVEV